VDIMDIDFRPTPSILDSLRNCSL